MSIRSLENGHFLLVDDGGNITDREYWDLPMPPNEDVLYGKKESSYLEELEYLFENAVKLRLRADVPTGLYLSGGLDSALIAMKVDQLSGQATKKGFSIDFPDAQISESVYQRIIANKCHAALHQKTLPYNDISKRLQEAIYYSECPLKETYNIASLHLSRCVKN